MGFLVEAGGHESGDEDVLGRVGPVWQRYDGWIEEARVFTSLLPFVIVVNIAISLLRMSCVRRWVEADIVQHGLKPNLRGVRINRQGTLREVSDQRVRWWDGFESVMSGSGSVEEARMRSRRENRHVAAGGQISLQRCLQKRVLRGSEYTRVRKQTQKCE